MGVFGTEPGQIEPPTQARSLGFSNVVPFWAPGSMPESFESPSPWDVMWIGEDMLPGIVRVQGARKIRVDERGAPGSDGQTLTFLGRDSSEIMVKLRMWTEEQLEAWAKLVPRIQPPPGRKPPTPFDVYHPATAINEVKSLFLLDCGVLGPSAVPDVFETQLRFVEFLPAKKTTVTTPLASKSSTKIGEGKPQRLAKPSEGGLAP